MTRHLRISLEQKGVSCIAAVLEDDAPETADIVWDRLPLTGPIWHAKYASNEVYTLTPPLTEEPIAPENPTVAPTSGDVVIWDYPAGMFPHGIRRRLGLQDHRRIVDIALFYGRNNLTLSPQLGWYPCNVFATVVDGLEEMKEACYDLWVGGWRDERLTFERA
jgi:Protein of unknown function (DUF3830)